MPDPKGPQSPDQLQSGIHGRVEGVTRVGPRAVLLGFLIGAALLGGIIYGLTAGGNKGQQQTVAQATPPVIAAPPSTGPHFGEDVPIVESPPPETPPPAVLLPPSPPPPSLETVAPSGGPGGAGPGGGPPTQADLEEQKRLEEERQREAAAEAAREAELKRANEAPIFASMQSGGFSGSGGGGATGATSGGTTGATGAAGGAPGTAGAPGTVALAPGGVAGAAGGAGGASGGGAGGAPGAGGAAGAGGAGGAGGAPAAAPTINPAYAYLSGPMGQFASTAYALPQQGPLHNDLPAQRYAPTTVFELLAGAVMPAILITGIDSSQPGLVTAQIRENVYDTKSGRFLLIPAGSRLVGVYNNEVKYGQSRVLVAWQRLIFPDTSSIDLLKMTGADVQGGAGLGGRVDNHTSSFFLGTFLTSILSAAISLSQPQTNSVVTTAGGTVAIPSQGQIAAQGVGQNLTNAAQQLLQRDLNLPPTVYIPKGYPFIVVVDRDMVFPGPYAPYVTPGM